MYHRIGCRTQPAILGLAVCCLMLAALPRAQAWLIENQSTGYKGYVSIGVFETVTIASEVNAFNTPHGSKLRNNKETVTNFLTGVYEKHFWNCVPLRIEVADPLEYTDLITIPMVMAVSNVIDDTKLRPLASGVDLTGVEMEDGFGNWHAGTVDSFFDVFTELPVSGGHGEQYQWDIADNFIQPTGNFFLGQVTMTVGEFLLPEPASLLMLLGGTALLRRR